MERMRTTGPETNIIRQVSKKSQASSRKNNATLEANDVLPKFQM